MQTSTEYRRRGGSALFPFLQRLYQESLLLFLPGAMRAKIHEDIERIINNVETEPARQLECQLWE